MRTRLRNPRWKRRQFRLRLTRLLIQPIHTPARCPIPPLMCRPLVVTMKLGDDGAAEKMAARLSRWWDG
ncbi:MAG: hypothetical protein ACLSB9_21500 [Hydrogeniiclostridium mannosilyticum]